MFHAVEATEEAGCYVFVHGPHRRGASQGYQLADVHLYCPDSLIHGRLWQAEGNALLVPDSRPGAPWVRGDIYRVDEDRVRLLDDFHGIPPDAVEGGHFRRVEALVHPFAGAGRVMHAWIWEWTGSLEGAVAVPSGDWMEVELPRKPPTLTMLAAGCMVAAPLCIGLAVLINLGDLAMGLAICGLTAPCIAAFANYFGGRRRERWRSLRIFMWYLLVGIGLFGLAIGLSAM